VTSLLKRLRHLSPPRSPSHGQSAGSGRSVPAEDPGPAESQEPNKPERVGFESADSLRVVKLRRSRDNDHLRFIAIQPCTVCGRQPCEAHHLRYSQPRALGRKVSDEFTVPLCRVIIGSSTSKGMNVGGGSTPGPYKLRRQVGKWRQIPTARA
jgi:hypothetical protein